MQAGPPQPPPVESACRTHHIAGSSAGFAGLPRPASLSARSRGTGTRRFARPGVYRYACSLHPGMTGRVVVR